MSANENDKGYRESSESHRKLNTNLASTASMPDQVTLTRSESIVESELVPLLRNRTSTRDGLIGRQLYMEDEVPLSGIELLSDREREVLELASQGSTSRKIGKSLGLSPKTVENHRSHILEKLGVANIAAATALWRGEQGGSATKESLALLNALSPREQQVLGLIGQGFTSKEIARKIGLVLKTVENHRSHILEKLGVANIAQAIALWVGGRSELNATPLPRIELLYDREREVLDLLRHGLTSREIARKLRLSPKTVEYYRVHILNKLGVTSSIQAVVLGEVEQEGGVVAEFVIKLHILSPRESEVLELSSKGLTSKEVARKLGLSPKTVANHRSSILNKLEVPNMIRAAVLYSAYRSMMIDRDTPAKNG